MEERKKVVLVAATIVVCAILVTAYLVVAHDILGLQARDELRGELAFVRWEAQSMVPPDTMVRSQGFEVHGDFRLSCDIELPSHSMDGMVLWNTTLHTDPFVNITLIDPDGVIAWSVTFNESTRDELVMNDPMEGLWFVRVEARGHGGDDWHGLTFHDRLEVVVETVK